VDVLLNILTIDLEEWYDPEYVKKKVPPNREEQVTRSVNKTIRLLCERGIKATFFVVGEIAKKHPELIELLKANGHEIAFHGYRHEPLWNMNAQTLRCEVDKFCQVIGEKCLGFRAPSFSLSNRTKWAVRVLSEEGFKYDSSIFPAKTPLYGISEAPLEPYKLSSEDVSTKNENGKLWEFPLLVYSSQGFRLPVAGGFYLRFFPLTLTMKAIRKANRMGRPAVMYFHTWELNPETPRLKLGLYKSFVTYHNIERTATKLKHVLSNFRFTSVSGYMEKSDLT